MPLSPLLTHTLPTSTPGPYKSISLAYLRSPPLAPFSIPSPTLKGVPNTPALRIDEVAYSVFYPSETPRRRWWQVLGSGRGVGWVPEPKAEVIRGYERFVGKYTWLIKVVGLLIGRISMPLFSLLPLHAPAQGSTYPLVIFSHGLAGTRHTYSTYCTALASQGYVVLAIEHRDGSGPSVSLPPAEGEKRGRVLGYTRKEDLDWGDEKDHSLYRFRELQLEMRVREVYEAYESFRRAVSSDGSGATEAPSVSANGDDEARRVWLSSLRGKVDFSQVHLTGHSFGGGTIMSLLQTPPPSHISALPVARAIALDPWLEPLPMPAASLDANPAMPPLLVINSPGFTIWKDHFSRLLGLVDDAGGWLCTLIGSDHQTFSDFPLLGAPAKPLRLLDIVHDLSHAFMHGKLASVSELEGKKPVRGKFEKDERGKMVGKDGEVVLHLQGKD